MRKKITIPKKTKSEIDKYPMVSVEWFDIVSDSAWTSFDALKKSNLATCITKGHLWVRPSLRELLNCTDRCPCSLILVPSSRLFLVLVPVPMDNHPASPAEGAGSSGSVILVLVSWPRYILPLC
jgi:hypothetical protein